MKLSNSPAEFTALSASTSATSAAAQKAGQTAVSTANAGKPGGAPGSAGGVAVTVSEEVRILARRSPEIDMQKVEAMRSAIEKGTFTVDHGAIADKLLGASREMINRVRGVA